MWWPEMEIGIKNIIKNYKVCNKFDNKPNPVKKSYPIPDPEPFEVRAIDIIGALPESRTKRIDSSSLQLITPPDGQ